MKAESLVGIKPLHYFLFTFTLALLWLPILVQQSSASGKRFDAKRIGDNSLIPR